MKKYYKQIWLTIVGILCISITMRCFILETLYSSQHNNYGEFISKENTYEGPQYVTAITTSKVSALQELERLGVLAFFVASFIFFGSQLPIEESESDKEEDIENPFSDDVELD